MASIQRIASPLTKAVSYRAQVRVKGHPAQSETFPNRKEAQQWAQSIETAIRERLDVPQEQVISRELDGMHPVSFARATNRRVLGSMNDFAFQARHYLARGDDLVTIADRLAHTPMSAIGEAAGRLGFPDMLARALLAGGVA